MIIMTQFLISLDTLLSDKRLLLGLTAIAILLKSVILYMLTRQSNKKLTPPRALLFIILTSSIIGDLSWVVCLINDLFIPSLDYRIRLFFIRIGWSLSALEYLSLLLFTGILVQHTKHYSRYQLLLVLWYVCFFVSFLYLAIFDIQCCSSTQQPIFELVIQDIFRYSTLIILSATIIFNFWKMYHTPLPRILKKQLKIFVCGIMSSVLFSLILQTASSFQNNINPFFITNSYSSVSICTIITTFAIFFSARKFMGLRFLNVSHRVEVKTRLHFMYGFKDVLEQLSRATSTRELEHITKAYLKDMFQVPPSRIKLYIRTIPNAKTEVKESSSHIETMTENFILLQQELITNFFKAHKLLVYDEIIFTNFYEKNEDSAMLLNFLDTINADIFIPIYIHQKMIGYIIIDRYARPHDLYSSVEYDEMVVYASYLGNIIHLMQTRNLEAVIAREKELHEELYSKHQEINQYKESIQTFLHNYGNKDIGIVFYKNRIFTYGNQAAQELIDINVNTHQGHPIAIMLKDLVRKVHEYRSPQTCFVHDKYGQKLVLSAMSHLEHNTIIIIVYYPEISDLIKKQLESFKDPSKWDYLLYLETTKSGKLINQLIPGSGEHLLNFKISLLQSALSKKATLLDMHEEDLIPTAALLHHISLRETLHTIKLTSYNNSNDIATKLFGINPIFGTHSDEKSLFERLDTTGTIFIQNIHFLDLETQQYLAEYLMYGMYRIFKSDQKKTSNVRIICSSNKNLRTLIQEGTFSQDLFNHLKKHTVRMPSLLTLPEHEIHQLAEGYTEQAITTNDFKNLLELTQKEKHKLVLQKPVSLHELKGKVYQLLINKSKTNHIYNETHFDPAYEITDPELIKAARLGKHALRDEKIMTLLWNKFQSQSKIASFLGVNRSSVNRRCQKYNLV